MVSTKGSVKLTKNIDILSSKSLFDIPKIKKNMDNRINIFTSIFLYIEDKIYDILKLLREKEVCLIVIFLKYILQLTLLEFV